MLRQFPIFVIRELLKIGFFSKSKTLHFKLTVLVNFDRPKAIRLELILLKLINVVLVGNIRGTNKRNSKFLIK